MAAVTIPINNQGSNEDDPIQRAIDEYNRIRDQIKKADEAIFYGILDEIKELCSHHNLNDTQKAFGLVGKLENSAGDYQGNDSLAELAASQNIESAIQNEFSSMQNDLNQAAKTGDAKYITDYESRLGRVMSVMAEQKDLPPGQGWIDPATATGIYNTLKNTIDNEFGTWDINTIAKDMQKWASDPSTMDDGGGHTTNETGSQHINSIQADGRDANNQISAVNQTLMAREQYTGNVYNQMMDVEKNSFQSQQSSVSAIVQNMGKQ